MPQGVERSGSSFAEQGLELGEELLDWIEIGTVGRQVEECCAGPFDGGAHRATLVGAEIVHDDDVAGHQGRDKELLDVGLERQPVDRAVDHAGSSDGVAAQGGQEGAGLPMAVRHGADRSLAERRTTIGPCHVGLDPGLVDEDQAMRVQSRLVLAPRRARSGDIRAILLGGMECLFLSVSPNASR